MERPKCNLTDPYVTRQRLSDLERLKWRSKMLNSGRMCLCDIFLQVFVYRFLTARLTAAAVYGKGANAVV